MSNTKVVNINFGEKYDVYIGRGSRWGNPWTHKKGPTLAEFHVDTREQAIQAHRDWITNKEGKHLMKDLYELKSKVLGCFCVPLACHCHTLAELADALPEPKYKADDFIREK